MDVRFCEGRNYGREAHVRAAAFCMFGFARSSEARVRRTRFLLTSTYMEVGHPDNGRLAVVNRSESMVETGLSETDGHAARPRVKSRVAARGRTIRRQLVEPIRDR
jgi:hypothetical protein